MSDKNMLPRKTSTLTRLGTVAELELFLNSQEEVKLYGAGFYMELVLREMARLNEAYLEKISCIMVSDINKNRKRMGNIPILYYRDANLKPGDLVMLTLGHRFTEEICQLLKAEGVRLAEINFNMFQEKAYKETEERLRNFLCRFPEGVSGLNRPEGLKNEITAWTCWWQGEEAAPELVKACFKSQKMHLPKEVRHIIITENNYKDYIRLPGFLLDKVAAGTVTLTTLSDVIRAALLYKYGGFWMDATLFVHKPLERGILEYPLYTRNIPETQYCTRTMWAGWFFYAKPGHKLFLFLWESFYYYFSVYDRITDYFMVDYMIALACNLFPEIERQLQEVPYNNEGAQELGKHLTETFCQERYEAYIKNTQIQKLTYKLDQTGTEGERGSIYRWILQQQEE